MSSLVGAAYLAALGLWIPLGILAAVEPPLRRRLVVPIVLSALGAAYEAYMTFVWSPKVVNPIRVDIFLLMFVLGLADLIAALTLLPRRAEPRGRIASSAAAVLCLAVPALAIAGYVALRLESAAVGRNLDLGRRYRFEAAFRDDATQRRFFGELQPAKNPWAGYYAGEGQRFAHLLINDDGAFWIYHPQLYVYPGHGRPSASDDIFEGVGEKNSELRMSLRRGEGDVFLLDARFGSAPGRLNAKPTPMKKTAPPRFPRPPAPGDEVRFAGVFSAIYDEKDNAFWLTQVWLWESKGEWWGQYLRDYYRRGQTHDFVWAERIVPVCSNDCRVLEFKSGRGPVTLTRISPEEIDAQMDGVRAPVRLRRGETLPGFMFDLAPLATKEENRAWLQALTTAAMISWTVPAR